MSDILQGLSKRPVPQARKPVELKMKPKRKKRREERGDDEDDAKRDESGAGGLAPEDAADKPRQKGATIVDARDQGFDRSAFLNALKGTRLPKPTKTTKPAKATEPTKTEDDIPPRTRKPKTTTTTTTKRTQRAREDSDSDEEGDEAKPMTKRTRRTTKRTQEVIDSENRVLLHPSTIVFDGVPLDDRLPSRKKDERDNNGVGVPHIRLPAYYMNNRETFINFINQAFSEYKDELSTQSNVSCESRSSDDDGFFTLMTHQKIVRDYLANYTPYRGVLLYHGLGSGKTCSSIAIAEGLKTQRKVIVMTPASLRTNYIEELKKCGDPLYKKQQHWEFVSLKGKQDALPTLTKLFGLSAHDMRNGVWMVNAKESANYETLSTEQRSHLDKQINKMISAKYEFLSYNGISLARLNKMIGHDDDAGDATTTKKERNLFDNKVVVIDEVHNFVSRIVNKLSKRNASEKHVAVKMYEMLMRAKNCRLVFLSGTPIINYPNELAVLFNMLRGYIDTWEFVLSINAKPSADGSRRASASSSTQKINETFIRSLFKKAFISDYIAYQPTSKKVTLTRNPYGFINRYKGDTYKGVSMDDRGELSDSKLFAMIQRALTTYNTNEANAFQITIEGGMSKVRHLKHKALPDDYDTFRRYFLKENGDVENIHLFQRRIIGLTSYYRSAQEQLMPRFDKNRDFHEVEIDMSKYQLGIYEKARMAERDQEKRNAKKSKQDVYSEVSSTYRVFSRAFCNFVFPEGIERPLPSQDKIAEEDTDAGEAEKTEKTIDPETGEPATDNLLEKGSGTYKDRLKRAIEEIQENEEEYMRILLDDDGSISRERGLGKYSPKFANVIQNVLDEDHEGCHLIYSQFRAVEGIELLTVAMDANGFTRFEVTKKSNRKTGELEWTIDVNKKDVRRGKPMYVLYTGTETTEVRELIRNIFNSNWDVVPNSILKKIARLRDITNKNNLGEIIKVFMITASGAEGISLRNTRYVHIMEPHWHPVRMEQVIGRARRICSHQDLPEHLRTVDVYVYLMNIPPSMIGDRDFTNMRLKDKSRLDESKVITSDQYLYEVSTIKEKTNQQLLNAIKSSAIDCMIHGTQETKCLTFGGVSPNEFSYTPSYEKEQRDEIRSMNTKVLGWKGRIVRIPKMDQYGKPLLDAEGKPQMTKYVLKDNSRELYDYDSYINATKTGSNPVQIGNLYKNKGGKIRIEYI